jgi:hypothetical protein
MSSDQQKTKKGDEKDNKKNKNNTPLISFRSAPSSPCPFCNNNNETNKTITTTKFINGIQILPLCFDPLQKAIQLRTKEALELMGKSQKKDGVAEAKKEADADPTAPPNNITTKKRTRDESFSSSKDDLEIDAAHAVYSQAKTSYFTRTGLGDTEAHRTGRWTTEEIAYSDRLTKAFDEGCLPLPPDTRLLPFLSGALLCKPTRLTKKMKKAKLSSRAFQLRLEEEGSGGTGGDEDEEEDENNAAAAAAAPPTHQDETWRKISLIELQDRFLMAFQSECDRLEYRFNLEKQWRTYFSEFCIQMKYPFLDASRFLESLEEYDRLASNAEELVRTFRRRKMGIETSTRSSTLSTISTMTSASVNCHHLDPRGATAASFATPGGHAHYLQNTSTSTSSNSLMEESTMMMEQEFLDDSFVQLMASRHDNGINHGGSGGQDECPTATTTEHSPDARSTTAVGTSFTTPNKKRSGSPFLDAIVAYLEQKCLPFQHADCWVPSLVRKTKNQAEEEIQLVHAGDITRCDQTKELFSAFENFGNYSKTFSFLPGKGLVGRVYSSGEKSWEFGLNNLDPDLFLRAGGAEEYGVRTAVGIPISTLGVGRVVVVLYSCQAEVPRYETAISHLEKELLRLSPEPKWKLVVEVDDQTDISFSPFAKAQVQQEQMAAAPPVPPTNKYVSNTDANPQQRGHQNNDDRKSEREIISLLGEQLCTSEHGSTTTRTNRTNEHDENEAFLFRQFMGMRLLLLKSSNRRSVTETEALETLKKSYECYSLSKTESQKSQATSRRELSNLLANEWQCLFPGEEAYELKSLSSSSSSSANASAHVSGGSSSAFQWNNGGGGHQHRSYDLPSVLPSTKPNQDQLPLLLPTPSSGDTYVSNISDGSSGSGSCERVAGRRRTASTSKVTQYYTENAGILEVDPGNVTRWHSKD